MQKRLFVAIGVLVLLGIVLAACSSSDADGADDAREPSPPVERLASCDILEQDWEQENCYIAAAINESNERYCDFIEGRTRNACLVRFSLRWNDVVPCDAITNDTVWGDVCYKNYAERNAEHVFCENVRNVESRDACFSNVAVDRERVGLCANVKNVKNNQRCIYAVAQEVLDERLCELLTNSFDQDVCYLRLAELKKDFTICGLIGYDLVRNECQAVFGMDATNGSDANASLGVGGSSGADSAVNAS